MLKVTGQHLTLDDIQLILLLYGIGLMLFRNVGKDLPLNAS